MRVFGRRASSSRKWKIILVSHTHWDREWYLPFQQFRANLVDAVDSLLDLMKSNPDYRYFTLDGQTIVLEDYLEVHPEQEEELRRLIQEGRILIGPWYVMPDEFLVSGESLVRNLLEGRQTAARFGHVMDVGYVPDPFGHIAQLPQIFRGFGIDSAVLWRGVGADLQRSEALWRSPDGSEVLLKHLPGGYSNAAVLPPAPDSLMKRLAHLRSELEPRATTDYLLLMNGNDHMFPQPDIPSIIAAANGRLRDAEMVHGTLPILLEGVRGQVSGNGVSLHRLEGELRSSELAHLLAGVLSARVNLKQRNSGCETLLERWAEPFSTYATVLDSGDGSVPHDAARKLRKDAPALLRLAWRYLLKNQPHDSICGCSIDQVHQEMNTRYDWCEQIAELTTNRALQALTEAVNTESILGRSPASGCIVVFNSESGPRSDFVTATVDLPGERSDLALVRPDGARVPWQILKEHLAELANSNIHRSEVQGYLRLSGPGRDWPRWKLKMLEKVLRAALRGSMQDLVIVAVDVIPGDDPSAVNIDVEVAAGREHAYDAISAGLRQVANLVERGDAQNFRLRVSRRDQVEVGFVPAGLPSHGLQVLHFEAVPPVVPAPHVRLPEMALENEFLSLQASPDDGSLRLIDRESGAIYWGLNAFVDSGDAGDEYTYSPPMEDGVVAVPALPPTLTIEEKGPARHMLRVDLEYRLPVGLSEDRRSRAEETVPCRITSRLCVYPGVPRVDVRTTVVNQSRDHRLRVLFPTHLAATISRADSQFAVIERPIEAPAPVEGWAEHPVATYPQMTFVDLSDGMAGLAIANRGLREYEIVPAERGPAIALTLLRCVGWLSRDDLATRHGAAGPVVPAPGAQMLGVHTFDYSIVPHGADWPKAMQQAYWFARPAVARWTGRHPGLLGDQVSFVSVSPGTLVLSAVKRAADGSGDLIVRLYNPLPEEAAADIRLSFRVRAAFLANLGEEIQQTLPLDGQALSFLVRAHQIVTIRLTP